MVKVECCADVTRIQNSELSVLYLFKSDDPLDFPVYQGITPEYKYPHFNVPVSHAIAVALGFVIDSYWQVSYVTDAAMYSNTENS